MAQSFWSKRKNTIDAASGYIKAADSVSRPTAVLMTVLGIIVVGGLLFGIFTGTRWAYGKLTDKSDSSTVAINNDTKNTSTSSTSQSSSTTSSGPSVTATSSTSTTTPSSTNTASAPVTTTTAASPANTTSDKLPQTGASSNLALFVAVATLSYLAYRKKLLKNQ